MTFNTFKSCRDCGTAWNSGYSDESDYVGECPRCTVEKKMPQLENELEEMTQRMWEIRRAIEATEQPCPACGAVGCHDVAYEQDENLVCPLGELPEIEEEERRV